MKKICSVCSLIVVIAAAALLYQFIGRLAHEAKILRQVVERLEADSRLAEVLVTNVNYDEVSQKTFTTIKFLEYDTKGRPLTPRYFTFSGNIIQFQSLVVRFDDIHIRNKDRLRGKSAYLFWKVFMLDGANTQEYLITDVAEIPGGYKLDSARDPFEQQLWKRFWAFALDPRQAHPLGVKNAQIEAPGMLFTPGTLYTIKIEHDGGMRIDAQPLPAILKGERIPE
jgi:hypothetical protein